MKYLILIISIPALLMGCGIQIHLLEGSTEITITKPPDGYPLRVDLNVLMMYCPVCGDCYPETISRGRWMPVRTCRAGGGSVLGNSSYRCLSTGELFSIWPDESDEVIWVNYWEEWHPDEWSFDYEY
jgi:hypothetical protein